MKIGPRQLLSRLGYQVQSTRFRPRQLLDPGNLRLMEFDDAVCRRMYDVGPSLSFVQVGVFDGVTGDPLRKFITACEWQGVMVEPQPHAAAQLRELYAGEDRIVVLQAALDREVGARPIYTVRSEDAPAWAGGLASFDRDTVLKHAPLIPGLAGMIREEMVDCITFAQVLAHLPSRPLDLLQIDAEGADAHILSCFPFEDVRPAIVHWEVKHLSKAEREACFELMLGFGYRLAPSGDEDMMALRF